MRARTWNGARLLLLLLPTYFAGVANVSASIIINVVESGGNVEASYSGSINLDATQGFQSLTSGGFSGYQPIAGNLGFTSSAEGIYGIDLGTWTPFGPGSFGTWDASSGDTLHLYSDPVLGLPSGYSSGTTISGNGTKNASSFASLGFTPGIYVSTLTNEDFTDSITVNIVASVPEPTTLLLLGLGLAGLGFARKRLH